MRLLFDSFGTANFYSSRKWYGLFECSAVVVRSARGFQFGNVLCDLEAASIYTLHAKWKMSGPNVKCEIFGALENTATVS